MQFSQRSYAAIRVIISQTFLVVLSYTINQINVASKLEAVSLNNYPNFVEVPLPI